MAEGVNGLPLFKSPLLTPAPEQIGSCHNWGRGGPRLHIRRPVEPEGYHQQTLPGTWRQAGRYRTAAEGPAGAAKGGGAGVLTSGFAQQDLVARYGSQTAQSDRANDRHGAVEETLCAQEQVHQPASPEALQGDQGATSCRVV
jgi:hypothetical protein